MLGQATVLMGPPASGKGTQGRRLAEAQGCAYLSTGRQLRKEIEDDTRRGRLAETFLEKGQYVPDHLVVDLVNEWLDQASRGWVLDGFPRTVERLYVRCQTGKKRSGICVITCCLLASSFDEEKVSKN